MLRNLLLVASIPLYACGGIASEPIPLDAAEITDARTNDSSSITEDANDTDALALCNPRAFVVHPDAGLCATLQPGGVPQPCACR